MRLGLEELFANGSGSEMGYGGGSRSVAGASSSSYGGSYSSSGGSGGSVSTNSWGFGRRTRGASSLDSAVGSASSAPAGGVGFGGIGHAHDGHHGHGRTQSAALAHARWKVSRGSGARRRGRISHRVEHTAAAQSVTTRLVSRARARRQAGTSAVALGVRLARPTPGSARALAKQARGIERSDGVARQSDCGLRLVSPLDVTAPAARVTERARRVVILWRRSVR